MVSHNYDLGNDGSRSDPHRARASGHEVQDAERAGAPAAQDLLLAGAAAQRSLSRVTAKKARDGIFNACQTSFQAEFRRNSLAPAAASLNRCAPGQVLPLRSDCAKPSVARRSRSASAARVENHCKEITLYPVPPIVRRSSIQYRYPSIQPYRRSDVSFSERSFRLPQHRPSLA